MGRTAIDRASDEGHTAIVDFLAKSAIKVNYQCNVKQKYSFSSHNIVAQGIVFE